MTHSLQILRHAQKELAQLPTNAYEQTHDAIRDLSYDPRPRNWRQLTGREGWRIRVGHYRVIYEIDDRRQVVAVAHVGHRRDVYR